MLVGLGGQALAVDEVEQSAELLVPAGLDGQAEDLLGRAVQLLVAAVVGLVHHEPAALDVVPRVHHAAGGVPELRLALQVHALQRASQLRAVMPVHDAVGALARVPVVLLRVRGVHAPHDADDVQEDHRVAQRVARARFRDGLGPEPCRVLDQAVVQVVDHLVRPARALQMLNLACEPVVLGVRDGVEALREAVAPLAQGLALGRHREVQAAARLAVDAVLLQEVQTALSGLQPFGALSVQAAQVRERPGAAPLHPYALVGGVHLTRAVEAGVNAAVLAVHAVREPEVHAGVQLGAAPVARGG